MKRKTIKDIAEAALVSPGTVDRVLHGRDGVAKRTRDRIIRLIDEMNYPVDEVLRTSSFVVNIVAMIPLVDTENTFWACHREGIEQQAQQMPKHSLKLNIVNFSIQNENDFCKQAEKVIAMNPDGVIVAPVFKKESQEFIAELDQRNIPYIFIDTMIDGTSPLCFIGEDAYQSGRVAASLIDFGIEASKDILMINLARNIGNMHHLNQRNQGFLSYFLDEGRNHGMKIALDITEADTELVRQKLNQVLTNSNIGAIWVSGSRSYIIAKCLEEMGKSDIVVVGYDVYDKNIEYLKRNSINFLIAQQPKDQGRRSLKAMIDYITQKQQPVQNEYQKVEIVNAESLCFY
ncbi:MAG: LacI family DNA-binding transcriptional regulator [Bacteroidales bacterium]|nr:LacI family DNA-binding transcriptional regulator [Bacteroidales bacterium]